MSNDIRNEGMWEDIRKNREFMKCPDFMSKMPVSDQVKRLPQPSLGYKTDGKAIEISADFEAVLSRPSYADLLDFRRSERIYDRKTPMTQSQLAFLLWSTQGIQSINGDNYATFRPVPSGGARHPFETYFIAQNVEGLQRGLYRYLPLEHVGEKRVSVEFLKELDDYKALISGMLAGQKWAATAQVVVLLSCVAYRSEWRYIDMAHRVALIDLGHVGQNLMLSAAAMGLGSCCMAAYDQALCDETLDLDGFEEYTVYTCAVGCLRKPRG